MIKKNLYILLYQELYKKTDMIKSCLLKHYNNIKVQYESTMC